MDVNLLAKQIVGEATGVPAAAQEDIIAKARREGKNVAAVILGQLGGLKGGRARAASLSAAARTDIARKAAKKRWAKAAKVRRKRAGATKDKRR